MNHIAGGYDKKFTRTAGYLGGPWTKVFSFKFPHNDSMIPWLSFWELGAAPGDSPENVLEARPLNCLWAPAPGGHDLYCN
jgi:hypothetical protein